MARSSTPHHGIQRRLGAAVLLVALAVIAAIAALEARDRSAAQETEERALTRPIRIELQTAGLDDFLTALRVYHYTARPTGNARFEDVYYDTPRWALHASGTTFRLRIRDRGGDRPAEVTAHLERRREATPPGAKRIEIDSELDATPGSAIAAGAWQEALRPGIEATDRLLALLPTLGIEPGQLAPRLRAEVARDRFGVTDKGTTWFELDHELWRIRRTEPGSPTLSFEDVVLDTRLKRSHPEIERRVSTMQLFAGLVDGAERTEQSPHERAIDSLSAEPSRSP